MEITLFLPKPHGTIGAIPSKSCAHRILICAALADKTTVINCSRSSDDIDATVSCLRSLGAEIDCTDDGFIVTPIISAPSEAILHPGESGSTLRFLLPVASVLGTDAEFITNGRLSSRPLSPLTDELERHGAKFMSNPIRISGRISPGTYTIDSSVSSQFTTGLMLALPYFGKESVITLNGNTESKPYITLTAQILALFGINAAEKENAYALSGKYKSPSVISVEGDWSNAAFMLAMGAISDSGDKSGITVTGLNFDTSQGDRRITDILSEFGAAVSIDGTNITVKKAPLHGIELNASDIPDLVPIVSVLAMAADGDTVIHNCGRLRFKESDRIESICRMIGAFGGNISVDNDIITVHGGLDEKDNVVVDSFNDHRIVMASAAGAILTHSPVTITNCEAVSKSYPNFFDDLGKLCIN